MTITRTLNVGANQDWTWSELTEPDLMGRWLNAKVRCTPEPGGEIDILWSDGSHVGGEVVLSDAPHHLITHRWDADSLAKNDDPGLITVMRWTLRPVAAGLSQLELVDTGYHLKHVSDEWMAAINEGWDEMLGNLVALSEGAEDSAS